MAFAIGILPRLFAKGTDAVFRTLFPHPSDVAGPSASASAGNRISDHWTKPPFVTAQVADLDGGATRLSR